MSFPPLDSVTHCPKCGLPVTAGTLMDYGIGGVLTYGDGTATLHDEYIERTCRRCSYRWKEAPLDEA